MSCCAAATSQEGWGGVTTEYCRDPVTEFNPVTGGLAYGIILARDVQDLGPEPLAGVDPSDILTVVGKMTAMAEVGDLLSFGDSSVILPQNKHRIGVSGELGT